MMHDELDHLAPLLASLQGRSPFSIPDTYFSLSEERLKAIAHRADFAVPQGYFDVLSDRVSARITDTPDTEHAEELAEAPLLRSLAGKSHMSVPEGLFSLPGKWTYQPLFTVRKEGIVRRLRHGVIAAAVVIGIVMGLLWPSAEDAMTPRQADITTAHVQAYILANLDDFDEVELMIEPWQDLHEEWNPNALADSLILDEIDLETLENFI